MSPVTDMLLLPTMRPNDTETKTNEVPLLFSSLIIQPWILNTMQAAFHCAVAG